MIESEERTEDYGKKERHELSLQDFYLRGKRKVKSGNL